MVISHWVYANTSFGEKGVKDTDLDWMSIAQQYKTYLKQQTQERQRKEELTRVFRCWKRQTVVFQKRRQRQIGRICANIAAARARGSEEEEFILALI